MIIIIKRRLYYLLNITLTINYFIITNYLKEYI